MKDIGLEVLKVLIILLPGFLTLKIVEDLAITRPFKTDLERVIQGLVYTFIDYSVFCIIILLLRRFSIIERAYSSVYFYFAETLKYGPPSPISFARPLFAIIIGIFLTSLIVGLTIAWFSRNGHITDVLIFFRFTARTGRPSIWSDVFLDMPNEMYLAINFADDDRRLTGKSKYFSDTPEEGSIFLKEASWVKYNKDTEEVSFEPIDGPGIFITKEWKIESIEFLYPKYTDTAEQEPRLNAIWRKICPWIRTESKEKVSQDLSANPGTATETMEAQPPEGTKMG